MAEISNNILYTRKSGEALIDLEVNTEANDNREIKDYALYQNENIGTLALGTGISKIGEYSLAEMSELTSATLPNNSSFIINQGAFFNNEKLKRVNNTTTDGTYDLSLVQTISGNYTFANNKEMILGLFNNWINYPTSANEGAFSGCTKLTTVKLKLPTLGYKFFEDCPALSDIYLLNPNDVVAWTKNENPFSGINRPDTAGKINIHVPTALKAQYEETYSTWASLLNFVEYNNNGTITIKVPDQADIEIDATTGNYSTWNDFIALHETNFIIQYGLIHYRADASSPGVLLLIDTDGQAAPNESDLAIRPSDFIDFTKTYNLKLPEETQQSQESQEP